MSTDKIKKIIKYSQHYGGDLSIDRRIKIKSVLLPQSSLEILMNVHISYHMNPGVDRARSA